MSATLCNSIDCGRTPVEVPPLLVPTSGIDLMAKDYDSLLRAMLDLLPARAPGWAERSEADLGMALLELYAYVGDQLSYLQDRVALEGFLRTATQYESVKKLLQLVDYDIYPGHAASTALVIEAAGNAPLYLATGFQASTMATKEAAAVIYETQVDIVVVPTLSRIALSIDAPSNVARTQAVLASIDTVLLTPGKRVLLQNGATREWATVQSRIIGITTTTVTFEAALLNDYPVSTTLLHGNVVDATHGETVVHALIESSTPGMPPTIEEKGTGRPAQQVVLEHAPLTYVLDADGVPRSTLSVNVDGLAYSEVEDFIDSEAADTHYRLVRDNAGFVSVHFGDGAHGRLPPEGAPIEIRYRVGVGEAGRVGADTLTVFEPRIFADPSQVLQSVRNPFASQNPGEPESMATAKLVGPRQLKKQQRAVTEADFESFAMAGTRIGGALLKPLQAKARIQSTGSWNTVFVSLDLPGRVPLDPAQRTAFEAALKLRKMAGTDVRVEDARYAALSISLVVDVKPDYFARDVRHAVERVLVGEPGMPASVLPFFAPGRFAFGQDVYLSDLYAAVSTVEGVLSVAVTRFKRLGDRYPDRESVGYIDIAPLEVARCDNNATAREHGVLYVRTCGGKEG